MYAQLSPASPTPLPRWKMAIRDVASSRQSAPCPVSSSRQTLLRSRLRLDGSLPGHDARWAVVFGSVVRGSDRDSSPASRRAPRGHYELGAYVVMSNHVHVLLLPRIAPSKLMQSLKGVTARDANRILCRTGETFWQAESYDHWVRDEKEWGRIAEYIENNPVKAGLVARAEDYRWSSAGEREKSAETSLGAAGTSVRATFVSPGSELA